ncbi:MAG: DUF551 domain-containing protein [Clostridia bacterium]|nr:DUF551 domain-containing protein [Clostridia bacterium]
MKELKDRLTIKEKDGKIKVCGMDETNELEKITACVQKLYEYEDLGFSPADIELLLKLYDGMVERQDKLLATIERYTHSNKLLEKELQDYRNSKASWIDVTEKLPDENVRCLVCCQTQKGFRSHNLAYYADGHWHGTGSMSGVTHWRELPILPIE